MISIFNTGMRILVLLLLVSFNLFSQSSVHYVGPVHSNQKNTLFAKEQYIYVTSPYKGGPVYIKISKFVAQTPTVLTLEEGRSISYRVGDDDETPLVITTSDLGKNMTDKGMMVQGYKDLGLTQPVPIFVETRFQAGNYDADAQTQYTSWNSGEPNDCCSGEDNEENYAHIWWNGLWNDLYNTDNLPFIIEFDYNIEDIGDNYIFLGLFDGHSYFISDFTRNWGESRNIAISLGGYLLSINTQEEQNRIEGWMQQLQDLDFFGYNNYGPWIGLFQDSSDPLFSEPSGGWRWDDGSSLNYFERQQANSSYLKGESAPGRVFRLGHGINNIQSTHRRVFFTVLAVESGKTDVKLSELGAGWEHVLGDSEDYEIDSLGNYTFSLEKFETHAFALDNVPGTPEENLDALVGALLESSQNIVVNVGFWGGSNSWQGNGRDIGFDQIKPIDNISNEYIFMRAAGQININGQASNTNEYPIIVAHEDNTRLWLQTNVEDTATTSPDYILSRGEYKTLYFGEKAGSSVQHIYLLSNKRVYGYQNMAGRDGSATKQAMMLVNGINPVASNKIDGIYNIEDIASTKFEMSLKILTSTGADLILNGVSASSLNPQTEQIIGREDFSWYYFDNNDLELILPLGPDKRLTIESDGPVYGQYYGYNSVQGLAGYFYSYSDFDKDGITDADDLDDDNDGILDYWEGDTDSDGDGILNRYDLDSDGDGCFDVVEAGFTDQDDNGILGYGTSQGVYVDDRGMVIQNNDKTDVVDGYTLPEDNDNSSAPDFREYGYQVDITSYPEDIVLDPCPDDEADIFFEVRGEGNNISYKWLTRESGDEQWIFLDKTKYKDIFSNRLEITDFDTSMVGRQYMVILETRGFQCGNKDTSNVVTIKMRPDNDRDCIPDDIDLDDDNDGIYDKEETEEDLDGDGVKNSFDLDSDGDNCYDVSEAGFGDVDEDGISGSSPVSVDTLGRVIFIDSTGSVSLLGYSDPLDADINGIRDYKEISESPNIISNPLSVEVAVDRPASFSVTIDYQGPLKYQWQLNLGDGWINLEDTVTYSGLDSTTLSIDSVEQIMDGSLYRLVVTSALVCSDQIFSSDAKLTVLPDNDRDRVPDIEDLDDDNDGILDTEEGSGDADNDGIPNIFDLDSDDDGCLDVIEAGYSDSDSDGLLGVSPVTVDSLGMVTSNTSGYVTPEDRDGNGVYDFLEVGSSMVIVSNPSSVSIIETRNARYEILVDGFGTITYQWMVSEDGGLSWDEISDDDIYSGSTTSTLTLTDAPLKFNDFQFKVSVSTPGYVCDEDIESGVALTVLPDNDKDGIADEDDLDDDNDGILDRFEGSGDDDNDGILNIFDLDSDGDGCYDVVESGCFDPDDDGLLGSSPVKVDGLGLVVESNIVRYDFSGNGFDSSGNNVHGITEKTLNTSDRYGIPNSSLLFDGQESYFKVNDDSILDLSSYDRFLISMWIRPDKKIKDSDTVLLMKKGENSSGWRYYYTLKNDTSRLVFDNFNGNLSVSGYISFNPGDWYHVVLQRDGSDYTHFVNGDTLAYTKDTTSLPSSNSPLIVGGSEELLHLFSGEIDDILITGGLGYCSYREPADEDESGIYDFQEFGGRVILDSISESKTITEQTGTYFSVSSTSLSDIRYKWQYSTDGGDSWSDVIDSSHYSGFLSDTLRIFDAPLSFNENRYRVVISTPSFKCGDDIISSVLNLSVLPDNDVDGIPDSQDLDDDNDGIYDVEEGSGDVDGDGIINSFDLDSDGDGCYDVTEAGFTDEDGDGILGPSPVLVDDDGLVISGGTGNGYTEPVDRDSNFKPDYLEFASKAFIIIEPEDIYIVESLDSLVRVTTEFRDSETMVLYTWQVSENGGITWEGISNSSNILEVINADVSYNERLFRVIVSTPSFICGGEVISDPFRVMIENDYDTDFVGDFSDLDDDNDGIYDSVECENTSSILLSGDVDTLVTSGYPITVKYSGNTGSGEGSEVFGNNVNVSMFITDGDIYEGCYFISEMNFDDGIEVRVGGKTILSFDQYHWDITSGKADTFLTREFNGGIFGKRWTPWNGNIDIELVIRDGSIKLYSETVDGRMVDVIPYMDNTVEGWVLDKNFSLNCREGFNLDIRNTNHEGPSSFISENTIYAYVCSDTDSDGDNNNRDRDSDDDDCFDVREAGFQDPNDDGRLGDLPTIVDSLGLVLNSGGYDIPVDNDGNGVYDFLEEGFTIDITASPESYTLVKEGDTFSLSVDVELSERFVYQWQFQDEYSLFWENLSDTLIGLSSYSGSNTNTLEVSGVNFEDNQLENIFMSYRLIISSPAYLCEDDILTSPFEIEVYHKDLHIPSGFSPNNDGINDTWVVRGLEQYPNHRVRVYNIWNTRVFESENYLNDWDGTNQTQIYFGDGRLPEGTYYYIFDLGNGKKPLKGFVFIKRD